ncbi:MAG: Uma2 family endonuclease [Cyclobacteriaceae bacterium]|nr:Uma2 family endonuclease [Cyclobacteriaceae bacterium]
MHESITRPPKTIMEVYKMLPEGTLAELINGILYMSPSPVEKHQRIITRLISQIYAFIEKHDLGEVFTAPFDVYLDDDANAVQPDILFIAKENLSIIQGHVHGVPDLIIEILSEGNPTHDTKRKKDLYEKFGVKEYWIIDPETRQATGYTFADGVFKMLPSYSGQLVSPLLGEMFSF